MKPTILFDLDGTLIDSTSAILEGFHYAFDKFNLPRAKDSDITSQIGYPLDIMFANLGINANIDEFVKAYKEKYLQIYLNQTVLLDTAYEAVKIANSFADLGIVTTKTSKFSHILLEKLGIYQYFMTIIGREDVVKLKPDAEPILKALKNMNKSIQNAFMVGDTKLDGLAAKAANIKSIGVKCGYGNEEELKIYCDFIYKNPLEAVLFVKNKFINLQI